MAATLTLTGTLLATPLTASGSGDAPLPIPLQEIFALSKKHYDEVTLTDGNPLVVNLGGLSEVNVLFVRATGGKVRLRVTSSDGALQAIPVDPFHLTLTKSVGITAFDLTRDPAISNPVTVRIFLGQKA